MMLTAALFLHLAATGVHDSSSRSHAVLRIYIQRGASSGIGLDGRACSVPAPEGVLTLVDLAGSEHRIDSMHHSADRRKEGACINASLMALKECIRARAAGQNASHQYRKSKLTMALKASFLFPSARTLIIATVSPASKDTEHSLNTLRHACIMDGQQEADSANEPSSVKETRFVTGGTVEREECGEVDVTDIARKNMAIKKSTGKDADARTSNGNTVLPVESQLPETTERQKAKSRRASEKRMFAKLNPECKTLLTAAREKLGNLQRQATRLRVGKPEADERHGTEGAADGSSRWEKSDNFSSAETNCNRYGGSGVSSHATANADNAKAKEREMEAEREREKERERKAKHDKRILFKKLHDSVYSSAATVPETLLKRQLVTLMKLNGFTPSEINAAIPPCESDDLLQPSPPKTEITVGGVRVNVGGGVSGSGGQIRGTSGERSVEKQRPAAIKSARGRRPSALRDMEEEGSMGEMIPAPVLRNGSASNTKPPTPLASPSAAYSKALQMSASVLREDTNNDEILKKKRMAATAAAVAAAAVENTAQTRKTRQEQAKAVRDKLDAEKRAALLKKLGRTDDRSYAVEGKLSPEERDRERELDSPSMVHASEIARLQADLASNAISSPIAQSIRKQIQGHQAILERGKLSEGRRPSANEGSNTGRRRRSSARVDSEDDSEVEDRPQSAQLHRPHTPKTPAPRAGEGTRSMSLSALGVSNRDPGSPRAQMGSSSGDKGGQNRHGDFPGKALKPPRAEGSGSRPHLPIVSGVVEDWGDALEREVLSTGGTTGYNSADNSFDNCRSQSRQHGSDVSGTDDNSPHSDRGGSAYQQQGSQWDGDQSHGDRRSQQKPLEQPRRRMSASQQHSYDHEQLQKQQQLQHRQQQQSYLQQQQYQHPQQLQRDGHHNYTQQHQQQQHQQQHNQHLNVPQHPQNTLGQRSGPQEPPKQRMSIQQQHKYEYDQEQIRLTQRQAEQQLRQQQQQQQKQQEQQNFIDQQRRQSLRTPDPEPVPVRHLRSNPAPQHRVGAAAAPWANELTWEREKSDTEF
jgi:ribosomal protein L12E/L44/L45/RPP1/RPP2